MFWLLPKPQECLVCCQIGTQQCAKASGMFGLLPNPHSVVFESLRNVRLAAKSSLSSVSKPQECLICWHSLKNASFMPNVYFYTGQCLISCQCLLGNVWFSAKFSAVFDFLLKPQQCSTCCQIITQHSLICCLIFTLQHFICRKFLLHNVGFVATWLP